MKPLTTLILWLCLLPLTAQAQILPPELRESIRSGSDAGNGYATYPEWNTTADPSWWIPPDRRYLAYVATGNPLYLAKALEWEPRESYPRNMDGGYRNALRQEGLISTIVSLALKPHMSEERWSAVYEPRLKNIGVQMVEHIRAGDLDECACYIPTLMLLDRELGTSFMAAERGGGINIEAHTPAEVLEYLRTQIFAPEQIDGGMFDASSAYHLNTASIWCLGASALGPDALPNFRLWLPQVRDYLLHSMAYDGSFAASHGDIEGGVTIQPSVRRNLCYSVIGAGGDPDGQLAAMANHFWPVSHGSHCYGIEAWYLFVGRPQMLVAQPRPPPDGLYTANGTGLVMYQRPQESFFGHWLNLKNDDHAYVGSLLDNVWYRKGVMILDRPGGYSIGSNEWFNHNGVALKGDGWLWPRKFLGAEETPSGFRYRGETWGPSNHYNHVLGKSGTDADFTGCRLTTQAELDGDRLTIGHDWSNPGDTFPSWAGDTPVCAQVLFTRAVMRPIEGGVEWTLGNQTVRATSPDCEDVWIDSVPGWDRVTFASWHLAGRMTVNVEAQDGPAPPPEPATEHNGDRWTLGLPGAGGRQTLRNGAHAGGGYGTEYYVRNGKLYVVNSFGNSFEWSGEWQHVEALPVEQLTPAQILAKHLRAAAAELEATK
jgi:hypothetical protein